MLVGIIPASSNFEHPADRRRPIYFFNRSGIKYEIAQYRKYYQCIYVTIAADLTLWSSYKAQWDASMPTSHVIFDFCDDLLAAPFLQDHLRAVLYYISGKSKRYQPSYKRAILKMISASDVIVCGSAEQKSTLDRIHPNVVVVRDYFGADIHNKKVAYNLRSNDELHILWEGLSHGNIEIFRYLRDIADSISGYKIHFHIATDPVYCRVGGRLFCSATFEILCEIFKGSSAKFHLYDWSGVTFSAIAASCDFAVIPIPRDSIMMRKPENKMLLLWQIGLPVIASTTESYSRVMAAAGLSYVAATRLQWREMILHLARSKENRLAYMKNAEHYLSRFCSEEIIISSWREVFDLNRRRQ
jgi:hypothetical protein